VDPLAKKLVAAFAAVAVVGFLASRFVLLLEPAAEREAKAACDGLRPTARNAALLGGEYKSFPRPAPDFKVQDQNDNMRSLSEFRGKVVFLNFWATWCPPCIDEVPAIEDLQAELGSDDFVVLALASNHSWEDIFKFFPKGRRPGVFANPNDLTNMTVFLDPPANDDDNLGAIAKAWGVPALPETFLIDRDGNIQHYFVNKRDWHSDVALTCIRSLIED